MTFRHINYTEETPLGLLSGRGGESGRFEIIIAGSAVEFTYDDVAEFVMAVDRMETFRRQTNEQLEGGT